MQIIKHTTGKEAGRICVLRTLASMEPGEVWTTHENEVLLSYVHSCCSRYGRLAKRSYSVSAPAEAEGAITITRKA